ncbi:PhoD-like phosphatase [Leptospira yanagawae serovar Saopaulo str. Sao Paulo = ATCC 700523]|uniref:PhoD-like phosphatase n=1 Tax=Leptospira yanagawae serovar Saopaulo str. Sao Paulo = ATCC 700523 TaxID=1249483 RepID=A0A5E8HCK7_9LEPT|nr:alkaline phosphatase D family protein [Leptospira yanagawae]EOQ88513.1 PhoD-like phosphatase [Leptospira yanagawae serovar Saopaulo str. Sao Paulo = ATCC 700523]
MNQIFLGFFFIGWMVIGTPLIAKEKQSLSIGFGSCLHQDKESPILGSLLSQKLDYLIFLGDIVYSDQLSAKDKIPAYEKQFQRPEWKSLRKDSKFLFTWDDHDFGINDSGAEYADRDLSRKIFLSYVQPMMPKNINFGTKSNQGVFYSYWIEFQRKKIHIMIPDTRYFRSPLQRSYMSYLTRKSHYRPSSDEDQTMLGKEQWLWMETELSKPSDLLIFVSSVQVIPTEQPFEKWNNLPMEREKLIQSLQKAKAKDVVILSGDRHIAEIHEYKTPNERTLVEITSSSLNLPLPFLPLEYDSEWKIGKAYRKENVGKLDIFLKNGSLQWKSMILDIDGKQVLEYNSNEEKGQAIESKVE